MKEIKIATVNLKAAIVNYFSDNVEIKINRAFAIMMVVIPVGSFIAWYVNK